MWPQTIPKVEPKAKIPGIAVIAIIVRHYWK